jgi:hypothetical protein
LKLKSLIKDIQVLFNNGKDKDSAQVVRQFTNSKDQDILDLEVEFLTEDSLTKVNLLSQLGTFNIIYHHDLVVFIRKMIIIKRDL